MSKLIDKLTEAQKYAMSIRPKVDGFPVLAEALRQAEIKMNRWSLPSCQSVYIMKDGAVVQQGRSSFPEFLMATWNAGVISYDADFVERKVTYYGANGESYAEAYPAVKL